MRIATWNINGVNRRLPALLGWLADTAPDVACLQELKSTSADFPIAAIRAAGYGAVWLGEPRWNGVAILARGTDPLVARRHLPGDPADHQARWIEAAVNGVLIACLYAPNGNPWPGPKYNYKLAWMDRMATHAASLLATGLPVVLAGDFNVVPTDADIYNTRSWRKNALLRPEARARYAALLAAGWTDTAAHTHTGTPPWTFWSYLRDAWPRDAGMRIDHLLASPALQPRITATGVDRNTRGQPEASDHAPAWLTLD